MLADWARAKVGDICEIVRGVTYKKNQASEQPGKGKVPILRATNIQDTTLVLDSDLVYVPSELVSAVQRLRVGDIVIATSSGSKHLVGKTAQVKAPWDGSFGAFCAAIRPQADIDHRYLGYFFDSREYKDYISAKALGVNINNLRRGDLEEISVPVAPKAQQQRIVAEIEKQFSRLDEAVANLKRVKANLMRYKAAVLKAAVEGKLASTERPWKQVGLGDIATSIRNGYSKKPDAEQGTRIFRISAVRPMELDVNDVRYLSGTPTDYEPFLVEPGDVLFTRYNGSRDYVGVCARVPENLPSTVYPDKLIRVRVPGSMLLPEFLVILASTGRAREYVESKIRTTAGQSGVSGGDLKALPLELPCVAEQQRIVAEVERRLSVIEELESAVETNLTRADRLRQTILRHAFAGKLVNPALKKTPDSSHDFPIAAESPSTYETARRGRRSR